jgi:Flp pilus assembly protein TadD
MRGEVKDVLVEVDSAADDVAAKLGAELTGAMRAPHRNPRAFEQYFQGRKYFDSRDTSRAGAAFAQAVDLDDQFAEAHAGLALALWSSYYETRDPTLVERATREARRAISLAPALPEAHLAWGVIELGRGHSVEARDAFQKAQRLAPADDAVCRRIADAYYKLGRYQDAERMYQRAIDLRPSYWENYNQKGYFYLQTGEFEKAKRMYRTVINLRPESDLGYSNLAGTLIMAGQPQEAEPLLRSALRINPTADGHINLGFVYYSGARYDQAAEEWQRAIELGPDDPTAYVNLGDAYRHLKRTEEAKAAYMRTVELAQKLLQVNPKEMEARISLSIALAGLGRCQEANQQAAQAIAEQPESPTHHYYAALVYAVCGDRREALHHARAAIEGGALGDVRSNPDLKPLLNEPAIQQLLATSSIAHTSKR